MPHVRGGPALHHVGRVHHHEALARCEQVGHVRLEHRVFGEVIDDVQGDGQVGSEQPRPVGEAGAVVEEEALGGVRGETLLAQPDGRSGYVQPHIARVVGKRELVAVAAPEFQHGAHLVIADERVEEGRFPLRE